MKSQKDTRREVSKVLGDGAPGWLSQLRSDFSSGHDLMVHGCEPLSGSVLTAQNLDAASDSVSPPLSAPPLPTLCLSLK